MDEVKNEKKKAYFLQRFIAFIIDMVIVSFVASLITSPFINQDKVEKLENETMEVFEKIQLDGSNQEEYLSRYYDIYYKTSRESGITTLAVITLSVVYFVVYQTRSKGQTLGKKLMKIRVVSDERELTYNQMIFRSFLSNSILLNMILFVFMLFGDSVRFFYVSGVLSMIQYIITFISALMIMNRKNGCAIHDKIAHTKVLREN